MRAAPILGKLVLNISASVYTTASFHAMNSNRDIVSLLPYSFFVTYTLYGLSCVQYICVLNFEVLN